MSELHKNKYRRKGAYIVRPKIQPHYIKDETGSMARKAASAQNRENILEKDSKPLTREEFDAARRKEEAEVVEEIRRLRVLHERNEREVRNYALKLRQCKMTQ